MQTQTIDPSIEPGAMLSPARMLRIFPRVVTVIAAAAGLVMRWANLGGRSLWYDEGYTAWAVDHPVGEIIRVIRADTAPPLYYILLHGWTILFGRTEAGLRSMSAMMSTISLGIFILIARRLLASPWARALAIAFFSLAFMQISFAHEARFYAMMTLLAAVDLYLVLLVCERSTIWRLAASAVAWACSLYTNNIMAVYLACLAAAWLVLPGSRSLLLRARDVAIASISTGICFAFWLPSLFWQMRRVQGSFWPEVPDSWVLMRTISMLAGVNEQSLPTGDIKEFWPIISLITALILLACFSRKTLNKSVALILFGVAPILLVDFYSHVRQSIFMDRAFLPSGVALPLLVALALEGKRPVPMRAIAAGLLALLLWLNIRSLPDRWECSQEEDWRGASAFAASGPADRRLTVFVSNEAEMLYDYYARHGDYSPQPNLIGMPKSFFAADPPQTLLKVTSDADLDALRKLLTGGKYDRVVLVASHSWWGDHDGRTLALLQSELQEVDERQFPQIKVFRFER